METEPLTDEEAAALISVSRGLPVEGAMRRRLTHLGLVTLAKTGWGLTPEGKGRVPSEQ